MGEEVVASHRAERRRVSRADVRRERDEVLEMRLEGTLKETEEYRRLARSLEVQASSVREELDRMRAEAAAVEAKRALAWEELLGARSRRDSVRAARVALERRVDEERFRSSTETIDDISQTSRDLEAVEIQVRTTTAEADESGRENRRIAEEIEFLRRARTRLFDAANFDETDPMPAPGPRATRLPPAVLTPKSRFIAESPRETSTPEVLEYDGETTPPVESITIRVADQSTETFYRIKRSHPLRRLVKAHASRKGVPSVAVVFSYRGTRIQDYAKTPRDLGVPHLALLECSLLQEKIIEERKRKKKKHPTKTTTDPKHRVLSLDAGGGAVVGVNSNPADVIVLAVRSAVDPSLEDTYYSISKTARLETVFRAHASRLDLPPRSLSFYAGRGRRLVLEAQTPAQLGLSDLAQLLCVYAAPPPKHPAPSPPPPLRVQNTCC